MAIGSQEQHGRGRVSMNLQLEVLDGLRQTFDIWFLQRLCVKHRLLFGFYLEGTWMWLGQGHHLPSGVQRRVLQHASSPSDADEENMA
ncbi:hypothetical protein CPC08DRAFT_380903 [Agrocybe pediades]|nr:hypothetical protein CPC08DRAFT_380903 [Agrocybe pediades]